MKASGGLLSIGERRLISLRGLESGRVH
jgi:hypothetical protein